MVKLEGKRKLLLLPPSKGIVINNKNNLKKRNKTMEIFHQSLFNLLFILIFISFDPIVASPTSKSTITFLQPTQKTKEITNFHDQLENDKRPETSLSSTPPPSSSSSSSSTSNCTLQKNTRSFPKILIKHLGKYAAHFKKTTPPSSESLNKDSNIHFEQLPNDIHDKIIDILGTHDKSVLALKRSSRQLRHAVDRNDYGTFSIMGTSSRPLKNNHKLCQKLKSSTERDDYSYYRQIRIAHVDYQFLWMCGMEFRKMSRLQELYVYYQETFSRRHDEINEHVQIQRDRGILDEYPLYKGKSIVLDWIHMHRTHDRLLKNELASLKPLDSHGLRVNSFTNSSTESCNIHQHDTKTIGPHKNKFRLEVYSGSLRLNVIQLVLLSKGFNKTQRMHYLKEIVSSGKVDVNHFDRLGNTALHACLIPDLYRMKKDTILNTQECLQILIDAGANMNVLNYFGIAPIHLAASLSYADPLRILLSYSQTDINLVQPHDNEYYDYTQVLYGDLKTYKTFLSDSLLYRGYIKGASALHFAITYPRGASLTFERMLSVNQKLIGRHYLQNPQSYYHQGQIGINEAQRIYDEGFHAWNVLLLNPLNEDTPAMELIQPSDRSSSNKLNLNIRNEYYRTVLHEAVRFRQTNIVTRILNQYSGNRNLKKIMDLFDFTMQTPLMLALKNVMLEISLALIAHGANVNKTSFSRPTPLMSSITHFPTTTQVTRAILQSAPDICARDLLRRTALYFIKRLEQKTQDHLLLEEEMEIKFKNDCTGLQNWFFF